MPKKWSVLFCYAQFLLAINTATHVRGGVNIKKNEIFWDKVPKGGGSDPNPNFCSEFPFFRNHKLSFPIPQNMCNSENLS